MDIKKYISEEFIKGSGIEIGALHRPLQVVPGTRVTYVDHFPVEELRKHYPELDKVNLVDVGIIDNGETLSKVADDSQDFVIASHFLEHCQDPINAIFNMLRVTRENGIVYISIPDKHYTFDIFRPVTPLSHLIRDNEAGANCSYDEHHYEYVRWVSKGISPDKIDGQIKELKKTGYSIHYHAWRQFEMLELLTYLGREKGFPILCESILRGEVELHVVLRKTTILTQLDKLSEMARKIEEVSAVAYDLFDLKIKIGVGFAAAGQNHAAECMFSEALLLKPNHAETMLRIALAQTKNGRFHDAQKNLIAAQKLDPTNESIRNLLEQINKALIIQP